MPKIKQPIARSRLARKDIAAVMEALLDNDNTQRVTRFVSPKLTVKATRQRRPDGRVGQHTVIFTFGKPNYAERKFIKDCTAAGEPFPVKKMQFKYYRKQRRE